MRVVFLSPHETGHMMPMLNVARAVRKAGHEVIVCTSDFEAHNWATAVQEIGGTLWTINCGGLTAEEWQRSVDSKKEFPFLFLYKVWKEPVRALLAAADPRPSVVVADVTLPAAMEAAEELGVALVINVPGPLAIPSDGLALPDPHAACQRGGVYLGFSCFTGLKFAVFMNLVRLADFSKIVRRHLKANLVLIHSFFGIDPPRLVPPNFKLTGPVLPPPEELGKRLQEEHPELSEWLRRPGQPPAVLISTGTVVVLDEWQVRALFAAVKQANLRAVWSLKEKQQQFLPDGDDPSFWISAWLPQASLMAEEAVKLVITHCGWGGTLECIATAKPVVCLPFFADQPVNAGLLVRAGCGELLCAAPRAQWVPSNPYREGAFTAESAAAVLRRVSVEPKYGEAATRMQRAALAAGGAEEAARAVERAGVYGTQYLTSRDLRRSFGGNIFYSAAAAAAAGLAALTCCVSQPAGAACMGGLAALGLLTECRRAP